MMWYCKIPQDVTGQFIKIEIMISKIHSTFAVSALSNQLHYLKNTERSSDRRRQRSVDEMILI